MFVEIGPHLVGQVADGRAGHAADQDVGVGAAFQRLGERAGRLPRQRVAVQDDEIVLGRLPPAGHDQPDRADDHHNQQR